MYIFFFGGGGEVGVGAVSAWYILRQSICVASRLG